MQAGRNPEVQGSVTAGSPEKHVHALTGSGDLNRLDEMAQSRFLDRQLLSVATAQPLLAVGFGMLLVNGAVALWLMLLGRSLLPMSVPLQWFSASTLSDHNSQHVMDFYSLLHAISGAALYVVARWLCPSWPVHYRLLLVIACGGIWEVVENTPWVITLFNDPEGLAVYRGDSIVNALSDSAFVALGFLVATRFPRWFIVVLGVLVEVGVAVMIHDGFVLGTIRLVSIRGELGG